MLRILVPLQMGDREASAFQRQEYERLRKLHANDEGVTVEPLVHLNVEPKIERKAKEESRG